MSDSQTLRLAHPDLTEPQLAAFISYQKSLLKALLESSGDDWAGRFAFAHAHALKVSKLDPMDHRRIASAVESYCGRLWSLSTVKERLERARAARAAGKASQKDLQALITGPGEVERLADLSHLAANLGAATMALLKAHEAELLELHASVAHAEGHGHLHQPRG